MSNIFVEVDEDFANRFQERAHVEEVVVADVVVVLEISMIIFDLFVNDTCALPRVVAKALSELV